MNNAGNLIKWKFSRLVRTVPFYLLIAVCVVIGLGYVPVHLSEGVENACELLCKTQSNIASMLDLFAGIFASLCIAHDMQNRFISAAVMTGNTISSVLFAECLGFAGTLFAAVFVPSVLAYLIGGAVVGFGGVPVGACILEAAIYAFVCVAAFGIVIPFSFCIKGEGFSCIVNLILLILLWCGAEFLFELEMESFLSYTAIGQVFMMCGGDFTALALIKAFIVGSVTLAGVYTVTYLIVRKMELK